VAALQLLFRKLKRFASFVTAGGSRSFEPLHTAISCAAALPARFGFFSFEGRNRTLRPARPSSRPPGLAGQPRATIAPSITSLVAETDKDQKQLPRPSRMDT